MTVEEARAVEHGPVVVELHDGQEFPGEYMGVTEGDKSISVVTIAMGMIAIIQPPLENVKSIVPQVGEIMTLDGPLTAERRGVIR